MQTIFGEENFVASIAWWKRYGRNNNAKLFTDVKDFLHLFRSSEQVNLLREPRTEEVNEGYANPDNDPRGDWTSISYVNPATKEARPNLAYSIPNPLSKQEIIHPTNAWKYSFDENQRHIQENRLWWGKSGENIYPRLKLFLNEVGGVVPMDVWTQEEVGTTDEASRELSALFGENSAVFRNPKPTKLIVKALSFSNDEEAPLILDFFGGSGTTAHAVMKLNAENGGGRKFLVIEMADYFHTVILPRVKKVAFSLSWRAGKAVFQQAKNGKNGSNGASPNTSNGAAHQTTDGVGVFCKYMALEQYEDTLRKVRYDTGGEVLRFDISADAHDDYLYNRYVFLSDEKLLEAIELDRRENRVKVDFTRLYDDVDIAETLSNLLGSPIRRITPESVTLDDGTAEGETLRFDALDFTRVKPLLWW
jgi:hypothetical protein